jgi:ubiquinone/menaquinone biosynthesis C-methylase UbiE
MKRDERLLRAVQETLCLDNQTLAQELHPDFIRYFGHLLHDSNAIKRYVEEIDYLMQRGGLRGHVLDLAAGFGVTAVCLRMLGVETATCLDISDTKVMTGRKLVQLLQVDRCGFHLGDGRTLPFANESFDAVLIKDAVSHFSDPMRVLAEVARVLKSRGRLVVFDDRNARNPHVAAATRKIWEMSETGSAKELRSLGMNTSFRRMRHDYIAQRFPHLEERELGAIADTTRGYTFEMLDRAVPSMLEGRTFEPAPIDPCVNPESGIVQERLVDPLGLARDLEKLGYRARLVPPLQWDPKTWLRDGGSWKGFWARAAVRMIWLIRALRPMLLQRMDHFIVAGLKP